MTIKSTLLFAATFGILNATSFAQDKGYHAIGSFRIPSAGGWDYIALSPVNQNMYVSHGNQVNILDRRTGDSTGVIPNTEGVHGIAFAADAKKGFTSNGRLNSVTVFDISTNAVTGQIKTGENPDAIMYDPFSKMIYVCNGRSADMTLINPKNEKVVQTIALGGKPETAVSDENGHIFVNIEDKNEVVVVNTKTFVVEHRWKTGTGEEPSGLAIDVATGRLFAGCGNKVLVVMDAANGKIIQELPIGDGCDGVGFDKDRKLVFSSNGDGTLTVIKEKSAKSFEVTQQAVSEKSARTLAVDDKTHRVYLPAAEFAAPVEGQKRRSVVPGSFHVLVMGTDQ